MKKANGEGSINRYKNGWRASLSLGYNDSGKIIRKAFYGRTKMEAINKMNEYKDKKLKGMLPKDEKITLEQWYNKWLFEFKANELKTSTIEWYYGYYLNYIKGTAIGRMKLKDINTPAIQLYYNRLLQSGKTPNTVRRLNKAIKSCLGYAKKFDYIFTNYCDGIVLPKLPYNNENETKVFTVEQQEKFLQIIKKSKYRMEFIVALGTGLRIGELVALRWKDIDFSNGILVVNKALSRAYKIIDGKRKFVIEETIPKTKSSIRKVEIPFNVLEELKKYKKEQDNYKKEFCEIYEDKDFVFANEIGQFIRPDTLNKALSKILKENNMKHINFHALRHTYATRLFERGVPLKTVQKLLGHASIKITADIYTHVMRTEKIEAVEKLNDLFNNI